MKFDLIHGIVAQSTRINTLEDRGSNMETRVTNLEQTSKTHSNQIFQILRSISNLLNTTRNTNNQFARFVSKIENDFYAEQSSQQTSSPVQFSRAPSVNYSITSGIYLGHANPPLGGSSGV